MTIENKDAIVEDQNKDNINTEGSDTPSTSDDREVKTIPYDRFAEVNQKMKEYEAQAKEFEKFKLEQERKKLESKGKYEEALTQVQKEFEAYKAQIESEKFSMQKESILAKYGIDKSKERFITGSSLEEIEESAKEFSELLSSNVQKQEEEQKKENLGSNPNVKKEDTPQLDWSVFFK